jgi:hypothetical protein
MKKAAAILGVLAVLLAGSVLAYSQYKQSRVLRIPPERLAQAFPGDTKDIFDNSEKFVLFSLDPIGGSDDFHGFRIIGQTELTDAHIREEIRRAFYDGLRDTEDSRTPCFNPRHGIRAVKNGETLDFVICFSCHHLQILVNGKETSSTHIEKEPQETFDRVLTEAGVPLGRR